MNFEYYKLPQKTFFILDVLPTSKNKCLCRCELKGEEEISFCAVYNIPNDTIHADLVQLLLLAAGRDTPIFIDSDLEMFLSLSDRGFDVRKLHQRFYFPSLLHEIKTELLKIKHT